jgi:hypothetical protein
VVNALGFEQVNDELGTAPSIIDGSKLVKSGEPSVINSLSGKTSGINIIQASGDPGAVMLSSIFKAYFLKLYTK